MNGKLSRLTRNALDAQSGDYVSKDLDKLAYIEAIKKKYGLERMIRFDIGKNTDGISLLIRDMLGMAKTQDAIADNLMEYPDNQYKLLRNQLALRHNLPGDFFVLGAGLESMIDHIARAVFDPGDRFVLSTPDFSVFEDMSLRCGAIPIHIPKLPPFYKWTADTMAKMIDTIQRKRPKLIWVSNPNNPTGQYIPLSEIKVLVQAAERANSLIVVDEAYGEYTDPDSGLLSASTLTKAHTNLMVLRTFSKMYGVPSARVGYMVCSSGEIRQATTHYRPMFPLSWVSLYIAQMSILDDEFVADTRRILLKRKKTLITSFETLPKIIVVPSDTNTFMLKHCSLSAKNFLLKLETRGIIAANLNGVIGIKGEEFIRMTVRSTPDNELFVDACKDRGV